MLEGGGKTPILTPHELEDIGFKIVVYPLSLIGVCIRAMQVRFLLCFCITQMINLSLTTWLVVCKASCVLFIVIFQLAFLGLSLHDLLYSLHLLLETS